MPVQSSRGRVLSTDNKKYEVVKRTGKTKRNFKFTSFIFVQNSFHAEPAHKIFVLVAKVPLSQILFVLLKQVNTLGNKFDITQVNNKRYKIKTGDSLRNIA